MLRYRNFCRVEKLRYRYVCRVEMLRYPYVCRVEMLRYRYVCRVEMLRYRYVCRVEMLRYRYVCRVEMLRYRYGLQGGNATLSLWRSIGRPVQQEQCESPLPNVSMKLKYLGWPEEILLSSRRRPKRPDRNYIYHTIIYIYNYICIYIHNYICIHIVIYIYIYFSWSISPCFKASNASNRISVKLDKCPSRPNQFNSPRCWTPIRQTSAMATIYGISMVMTWGWFTHVSLSIAEQKKPLYGRLNVD